MYLGQGIAQSIIVSAGVYRACCGLLSDAAPESPNERTTKTKTKTANARTLTHGAGVSERESKADERTSGQVDDRLSVSREP